MDEKKREKMRELIKEQLNPTINSLGRMSGDSIDILRKTNPGLAAVLNEFAFSKTVRDDPQFESKRVVEALEARENDSSLGKALAALEKELGGNPER